MRRQYAPRTIAGMHAPRITLVNLDAAVARRRHMVAQLSKAGVAWSRVGVDLRHADEATIAKARLAIAPSVHFARHRLGNAEVGCWLSHLAAWRRQLADRHALAAAVIEDDVRLAPAFATVVRTLAAAPVHDVVFLGTSSRNISTRLHVDVGGVRVHGTRGAIFNTWGYVIGRGYAEYLLGGHGGVLRWPIDHVLGGRIGALRPSFGVVQPAVVCEEPELGRVSQIQPSTQRLDRARWAEAARRHLLASRAGDWYYALYRWL